jgi:hypothetical protein
MLPEVGYFKKQNRWGICTLQQTWKSFAGKFALAGGSNHGKTFRYTDKKINRPLGIKIKFRKVLLFFPKLPWDFNQLGRLNLFPRLSEGQMSENSFSVIL